MGNIVIRIVTRHQKTIKRVPHHKNALANKQPRSLCFKKFR